MIYGTGVDLIELDRIRPLAGREKFIHRVLTPSEQEKFASLSEKRRVEFLAGRFAAKEAFSKAAGTGIGAELSFQDIEILNETTGKPAVTCSRRENLKAHLSITHTDNYACAFIILEEH